MPSTCVQVRGKLCGDVSVLSSVSIYMVPGVQVRSADLAASTVLVGLSDPVCEFLQGNSCVYGMLLNPRC